MPGLRCRRRLVLQPCSLGQWVLSTHSSRSPSLGQWYVHNVCPHGLWLPLPAPSRIGGEVPRAAKGPRTLLYPQAASGCVAALAASEDFPSLGHIQKFTDERLRLSRLHGAHLLMQGNGLAETNQEIQKIHRAYVVGHHELYLLLKSVQQNHRSTQAMAEP